MNLTRQYLGKANAGGPVDMWRSWSCGEESEDGDEDTWLGGGRGSMYAIPTDDMVRDWLGSI